MAERIKRRTKVDGGEVGHATIAGKGYIAYNGNWLSCYGLDVKKGRVNWRHWKACRHCDDRKRCSSWPVYVEERCAGKEPFVRIKRYAWQPRLDCIQRKETRDGDFIIRSSKIE